MFILRNLIEAFAIVMDLVLSFYMLVVILSSILSWVNPDPYNPIVRIVRNLTEPVYSKVRRFIPTTFGNIDFAPFIVILIIIFLKAFLVKTLYELANHLGY